MAKPLISPSLLSADFTDLKSEIEFINKSQADWFHLDIMDGVFVPNITFGFPVIKQIKKLAKKPLDVHLMIIEPDKYLADFKDAGADILTVHYEACRHLHRTIQAIKSLGMKAGVSLNPHTPVSVLEDILPELDMVLIMSVNPGFGGQKFIPQALNKLNKLKATIEEQNLDCMVQIDGGVDPSNAREIVNAGANVLVAGSAVFGADDKYKAVELLKNC